MAWSLFVKGLNGFEEKVHGIGARVLGGKASCELCWLAPGKYVCTDIPALTMNRKALFHSYREDVSKAESVMRRGVADYGVNMCLYSGKLVCTWCLSNLPKKQLMSPSRDAIINISNSASRTATN
jgi:hypothetical protein